MSAVKSGGRSAWRANFRELEEDAKRTALFGRGVRKTTPTFSPSQANARARARASACLPLRRGCLDSLENRRHTGTEFHGWRTRACRLETTEDSSERQFWSIAITRPTHRKRRTCHYSGAYLIGNLDSIYAVPLLQNCQLSTSRKNNPSSRHDETGILIQVLGVIFNQIIKYPK